MVQHSSALPGQGYVKIDSATVFYVDLRAYPREIVEAKLREVLDLTTTFATPSVSLLALVITAPQTANSLPVALARQGVRVIVDPMGLPLGTVLDRFRDQWRMLGTADSVAESSGAGGTVKP
jgi:hypothetical protein